MERKVRSKIMREAKIAVSYTNRATLKDIDLDALSKATTISEYFELKQRNQEKQDDNQAANPTSRSNC